MAANAAAAAASPGKDFPSKQVRKGPLPSSLFTRPRRRITPLSYAYPAQEESIQDLSLQSLQWLEGRGGGAGLVHHRGGGGSVVDGGGGGGRRTSFSERSLANGG